MKEEQEYLIDIANKIATLLDGNWAIDKERIEMNYPGIFLNGPDDKALHFRIGWNTADRLEISGSFRNGLSQHLPYSGDRERAEITVSGEKTPEQIVKDITKRLMPPCERVLAQARELKAQADFDEDRKRKALELVRDAMGKGASIKDDEVYRHQPFCRARYYGGDIKIEIELPVDKAIEILRLV